MTQEQLAKQLNGREIGKEITKQEEKLAKESGLVVVFGYSDDNIEFRGAIDDEIGCCTDSYKIITFDKEGILPSWDDVNEDEDSAAKYLKRKKNLFSIKAIWAKGEYSWQYETKISHVTFDILEYEDDLTDKYCKGIIFNIKDLI